MATSFEVAHINQQGVDLIIVFLGPAFGSQSRVDQNQAISDLTGYARAAGLRGTVVPVWRQGNSCGFIAPIGMHPFFKSVSPALLARNINKRLICD